MFTTFILLLLALSYVAAQSCSGITDCGTCSGTAGCGWCMNPGVGLPAGCYAGTAAGPSGTAWCQRGTWGFQTSQAGNVKGGFPFNPTYMDVFLTPNVPLTVTLTFTVPPLDSLDLDIVMSIDNSGSMGPSIVDLYKLVPQLTSGVVQYALSTRFGMSSFIDFTSSSSSYDREVQINVFRLQLSPNYAALATELQNVAGDVHGNFDASESGYDSMLYAAVGAPPVRNSLNQYTYIPQTKVGTTITPCDKYNWGTGRKIVVMLTDNPPKSAQNWPSQQNTPCQCRSWGCPNPGSTCRYIGGNDYGANSDQTQRPTPWNNPPANDGDCFLPRDSSGYYPRENYISLPLLGQTYQRLDIFPILYTYSRSRPSNTDLRRRSIDDLYIYFGRGLWGDATCSTSAPANCAVTDGEAAPCCSGKCCTLDQLVVLALQKMASTVVLQIKQDVSGFYVANTITGPTSTCTATSATPGCVFRWTLQLRRTTQTNSDLVIATVPGYGDNAISTMNVTNFRFFCVGCTGVIPTDNSVIDSCGICNGRNASCTDCFGNVVTPGSKIAQFDVCGVCDGDSSTCFDCFTNTYDPNGNYRLDVCGVCRRIKPTRDPLWNTTCFDCNGNRQVPGVPSPTLDLCGVCGGNNACVGCDGNPPPPGASSPLVVDACGICGGNNLTCADCAGVTAGTSLLDICGVCRPANSPLAGSTCRGCPGNNTFYPPGSIFNTNPPQNDICGVCGGDNSTCVGCDGVRNSGWTINICNVCAAPNATLICLDCFGNVDGPLVVDACGVCGGSTTDPKDCNKKNVETAVIAGAAVGAAVAVTMAALALFFFLMARKNPNWYIQDVIDKQETTHSHNPLYESQNKEKTNALYEAPRK